MGDYTDEQLCFQRLKHSRKLFNGHFLSVLGKLHIYNLTEPVQLPIFFPLIHLNVRWASGVPCQLKDTC